MGELCARTEKQARCNAAIPDRARRVAGGKAGSIFFPHGVPYLAECGRRLHISFRPSGSHRRVPLSRDRRVRLVDGSARGYTCPSRTRTAPRPTPRRGSEEPGQALPQLGKPPKGQPVGLLQRHCRALVSWFLHRVRPQPPTPTRSTSYVSYA